MISGQFLLVSRLTLAGVNRMVVADVAAGVARVSRAGRPARILQAVVR
jgi:hypothetical protein